MSVPSRKPSSVNTSIVLFAAAAATILGLVIVLILSSVSAYRARTEFALGIAKIDQAIRVADFRSAALLLDDLLELVPDEQGALRFYKRERSIRGLAADQMPQTYIHALQQRFPGSLELLVLRVAALLEERRYQEGWELSAGLPLQQWGSLRAEAALRAGQPLDAELLDTEGSAVEIVLNPLEFSDPVANIRAWEASADRRYLLNAASLYALRAELSQALATLRRGRGLGTEAAPAVVSTREALIEFLLVYDLEGAQAALDAARGDEFDDGEQGTRLLTDLFVMSGQLDAAAAQLAFLRNRDSASVEDILNEAWLRAELEQRGTQAEVLELGLQRYPESDSIKLAYYPLLRDLSDAQTANMLFSRWQEEEGDSVRIQAAWLVHDVETIGLAAVLPRLWELQNRFPSSDLPLKLIAYTSWKLGEHADLAFALDLGAVQNQVWTELYTSLEALRGNEIGTAVALGARISPSTANLGYLTASLRAALAQPGDVLASRMLNRSFERAAQNRMLSAQLREYYLYLAAWRALLYQTAEDAQRRYLALENEFPRSIHLSQIRFWLQEFRRLDGTY